jgi:hypothetical protein
MINSILDVENSLEVMGCCPMTGGIKYGNTVLLASIFDARGGYDQRKLAIAPSSINIHSGQVLIARLAADGLSYEINANSLMSSYSAADIASGAARIVVAVTAYRAAAGTPVEQVNTHGTFYTNGGIIGNNMAKVLKFYDPTLATNVNVLRVDSADASVHHLADSFISALYKSNFTVGGRANRV